MDLTEVPGTAFGRHPWEVARARFFRRVLADAGFLAGPQTVLDVGAGDGYLARTVLEALPAGSAVVCLDAKYSDEDLVRFESPRREGLSFVRAFPERRFDVILLLDVMEHVEDDLGFLRTFVGRNLTPGGVVAVSVPAWPALYSDHDRTLQHFRRYRPAACRALLEAAGLSIRTSGGLFHTLLIPRAVTAIHERLLATAGRPSTSPRHLGHWTTGPALSSLLVGALAADNAVSRALAHFDLTLPGLSFWALCRAVDPDGKRRR